MEILMSELCFKVLNGSVSICNLFAYYFFALCLSFGQDGTKPLKQPLEFLLVSFVALMAAFHVSILATIFLVAERVILWTVVFFLIECSLTTVVWLGLFYYTQIVPPRGTFTTWLKKNIKWTAYTVMTLDKLLFLVDMVIRHAPNPHGYTPQDNMNGTLVNSNTTEPWMLLEVFYYTRIAYILLSTIVMMISCVVTVRYLRRHMKNMESTTSRFTGSLQSQVRVTRLSTVQGILNIAFCAFFIMCNFFAIAGLLYMDAFTFFTVVSAYSTGTTVNFFLGQPIFRRRPADLLLKVSKLFQLNTKKSVVSH